MKENKSTTGRPRSQAHRDFIKHLNDALSWEKQDNRLLDLSNLSIKAGDFTLAHAYKIARRYADQTQVCAARARPRFRCCVLAQFCVRLCVCA